MRVHELKIRKEYFDAKLDGRKSWEIRKDDRGFEVGDYLCLREIVSMFDSEPAMHEYTGRVLITEVLYVHRGIGLLDGYVVISERPEDFLENDYPEEVQQ